MSTKYNWQKLVKKLTGKGNPTPIDISDWLYHAKKNDIKPEIKQYDLDVKAKDIAIDVFDTDLHAVGNITIQFGYKEINFQKYLMSGCDEQDLKINGQKKLNKYISKLEKRIQKINQ